MLRMVHDQVVVAEHRAPVREQNVRIARVAHLAGCEGHRLGRKELPFLDVDHLAGPGRRYEQISLAAQEGGYLEHVDVLGGHGGLFRIVDVGHYRYAEFFSDRAQHAQRLQIADAAERVDPRAVGLAVRRFEYIRYPQPLGDPGRPFRPLAGASSRSRRRHGPAISRNIPLSRCRKSGIWLRISRVFMARKVF